MELNIWANPWADEPPNEQPGPPRHGQEQEVTTPPDSTAGGTEISEISSDGAQSSQLARDSTPTPPSSPLIPPAMANETHRRPTHDHRRCIQVIVRTIRETMETLEEHLFCLEEALEYEQDSDPEEIEDNAGNETRRNGSNVAESSPSEDDEEDTSALSTTRKRDRDDDDSDDGEKAENAPMKRQCR